MKNNTFLSKLLSKQGFTTGTGATITFLTLLAVYSLSMVTSLPGLAVSPILDDLERVFKGASQLEIQMLESLPSLIIIPFILIAGRLSVRLDKRKLVIWGLGIFVVSSLLYLLPIGLDFMLFNSILLGVGAGMVIPLSTGLMAEYFVGKRRTQQLGIASGISNLSLVLATALAGYLAGIEWRLAFLVYSLSVVALILAFKIKEPRVVNDKKVVVESVPVVTNRRWPVDIMVFYFLITITALAVPFNLSIFMGDFGIGDAADSGTLISIYFLAITLPGFFITRIISGIKRKNNLIWLSAIALGSLLFMVESYWTVILGLLLIGFGYGVMQPLIYDRTSSSVAPSHVTFALALVMAMNYLAIILYPFLQQGLESLLGTTSSHLPFLLSAAVAVGYGIFDRWRDYNNSRKSIP